MAEKFADDSEVNYVLGPVEFSCSRLPIAKVEGHWWEAFASVLVLAFVLGLMLAGMIMQNGSFPDKKQAAQVTLVSCVTGITVTFFPLLRWQQKRHYHGLCLAIHKDGVRWNEFGIRFEEIASILPYEAPGKLLSSTPTLAKLFCAAEPPAGSMRERRKNSSFTIFTTSGQRLCLTFVKQHFESADIARFVHLLRQQRPEWFPSPDWSDIELRVPQPPAGRCIG